MPHTLSLKLIGSFEAASSNTQLRLRTEKARALLAYLATEPNRAHARDRLAALLWSEVDLRTAKTNLRSELSKLRKLLPSGILTIDRRTVQFGTSNVAVDAQHFKNVVNYVKAHDHAMLNECVPCATLLRETAELWRGEFLDNLVVNNAPDFDDWVGQQRRTLHDQLIWVRHVLLAHSEFQRDDEGVIADARQLALADPWSEVAQRALLSAFDRRGMWGAALEEFDMFAAGLRAELGVEPAAETLEVVAKLRADREARQSAPVEAAVPLGTAVSLASTPFFGRNAEIQHLISSPNRLITIVGAGGVGKTRLAQLVANDSRITFKEGSYFVPLNQLPQQATEDDLIDAIAEAVQMRYTDALSPKQQLFDFFRVRHVLVVLDNVEHLDIGMARQFMLEWLAAAPHLCLLVTSRERLRTQAEVLVQLNGLPVPSSNEETAWEKYAAIQLFVERARRVSAEFALNTRSLPHVIQLCRLLDGLPLGIELAAAWVEHFDIAEMAQEIAADSDFLESADPSRPTRHASLRNVFDYSWRLLEDALREGLARLSVFHGSFDRRAALAVGGMRLPQLAQLVDKSLLRSLGGGRYQLHSMVAGFSAEKRQQLNLSPIAHSTHAEHYLRWLGQQYERLYGKTLSENVARIGRERDNVEQAWCWAVASQRSDLLLISIETLSRFCKLTSRYREAVDLFLPLTNQLLDAPAAATRPLLFAVLPKVIAYLNHRRQYAPIVTLAARALELDPPSAVAAAIHCEIGMAHWHQWQLDEAHTQLDIALSLCDAPDQSKGLTVDTQQVRANTLRALGLNAYRQGNYPLSKQYLDQGLTLARLMGDRLGEGRALGTLASIARNQGDHIMAEQHFRKSYAIAQELGDLRGAAMFANSLGDVAFYQGHYDASLAFYEQSLALNKEMGIRLGEAMVSNNLGTLAAYIGDYDSAETHFKNGLNQHQSISFQRGVSWSYANLALVFHLKGQNGQAVEFGNRGVAAFKAINDPIGLSYAHTWRGHALIGSAELDAAQADFDIAATQLASLGHDYLLMETHAGRAEIALLDNNLDAALAHVELILAHLKTRSLHGSYRPIFIQTVCHTILHKLNDPRATAVLNAVANECVQRANHIQSPQLRAQFTKAISHNRPHLAQAIETRTELPLTTGAALPPGQPTAMNAASA